MSPVPWGAPFGERGGRLRGLLDLVAGHYPAFLFGFPVGALLPVFHFHETTPDRLEPAFRYLAENGYRTVVSDAAAKLVRDGRHPGPKTVMLAFDDALASLWMVVGPLLARYDLRAVAYAIPSRVSDAPTVRPTLADGPVNAAEADRAPNPFATWPELRALSASGRVDVQSHTWSHAMIFSGAVAADVVRPGQHYPLFELPRLSAENPPEYLDASRLGHPLFARRSRMSDARRFIPDPEACARLQAFVAARGGEAFFGDPGWRAAIRPALRAVTGRWETDAERLDAVEREIVLARDALQDRLGTPVRHICLPWGVTGRITCSALERVGVVTAFANRLRGRLAVAAGDDPFFLKRLPNGHLFALPGRGRRAGRTFI